MPRAILEACLPCALALAGSCCLLFALLQLSGAKCDWSRLGRIHRCESGAVQSLAFVLTFPLLLAVLMLIVQVSQLMIAQMTVHYAAFAGARSASVWLPAWVADHDVTWDDRECEADPNCPALDDEVPNRIGVAPTSSNDDIMLVEASSSSPSAKLRKIRTAVIQACAPMAPSRDVGAAPQTPEIAQIIGATQQLYGNLVPSSQSNSRVNPRLANKLAYSDAQTQVFVEWLDARSGAGRDSLDHRAYNVRNHPNPSVIFRPHEIGWQDPVTVYVVHNFALLPGPGRLLAKHIVRADGLPDAVSERIQPLSSNSAVYTTKIKASATMTTEGIKSIRPYVQQ